MAEFELNLSKREVNGMSVVAMANTVIPLLSNFKINEFRLFQFMLAHYDSRGGKDESLTFEATVEDFKSIFTLIDHQNIWNIVADAVAEFGSRPLRWRHKNVSYLRNWFSGAEYYHGEGRFVFRLNKDVEAFFLTLKKCFTKWRLEETKNFRKEASFKLYANLQQRAKMGTWKVDLSELKTLLGINGKYPRWGNFKERIIKPCLKEINEYTELKVGWTKQKSGRRVSGVEFTIHIKPEARAKENRMLHEAVNAQLDDKNAKGPKYIEPLEGQQLLDI